MWELKDIISKQKVSLLKIWNIFSKVMSENILQRALTTQSFVLTVSPFTMRADLDLEG